YFFLFFFFQAEDGIRDLIVTGVQTCALPICDCYVNVLRDAMAVDTLDKCGIYFGTTGGQVYVSADAGDSWTAIVHDLPGVLSIRSEERRVGKECRSRGEPYD